MNGNRLKALRTTHNYRSEDMANLLGVSMRTYQSYERNERDPSTITLAKLVVCFGVSADYLIGTSDVPDIPMQKIDSTEELDELRKKVIKSVANIKTERSLQEIINYIEYLIYKETNCFNNTNYK